LPLFSLLCAVLAAAVTSNRNQQRTHNTDRPSVLSALCCRHCCRNQHRNHNSDSPIVPSALCSPRSAAVTSNRNQQRTHNTDRPIVLSALCCRR